MNLLSLSKRSIYFLAFFICLLGNRSSAQTNDLGRITGSIKRYNANHLKEKVFLHTDRAYYLCGEILWFKAYLEDAANNKPLSVSKVVYAELLNSSHDPVLQTKIDIKNGSGSGSFALPVSLATGNYELRAYTNWMKNDSAFHFFRKIITVVNTTKNLDTSLLTDHTKYYTQIFPEGGNLVYGLKSLVAFKVNDNSGVGAEAEGWLAGDAGDTITHFSATHFGMGHFYFTPEKGKNYSATFILKDGTRLTKNLPAAHENGVVMHLSDEDDMINVSVNSSQASSSRIFLVGETSRSIDFSKVAQLNDGKAVFSFNKNELKDGIAEITLFNEDRQPVCERLYFKRPQKKLLIDAIANQQTYKKRSPVTIDLSTSDQPGNFLAANLSASVYRIDDLHQAQQGDIYSYLWLASDLKGFIQDPDYYFKNIDAATNQALDNLLLTQGWRTFDWNRLSTVSSLSFIPENRGHIITGKVTTEATGKPAAGVLVYLSVPGRRVQLYGCKSDENGLVHFDMNDFYGPSQIVLQTNSTRDSIYHLQIFSPFSDELSHAAIPPLTVSENNRESLESENLAMELGNAYHAKDLEKLEPLNIDTLPFYYKPYRTYLLDNYTRFTTMEEVMREYVLEVNVSRKDKHYHFNTFDAPGYELLNLQPSERMFENDPLILLDGVPVFDVDKMLAYDPLKVQKLDIVASKYIWGPIVADGIVSYTTYKGDLPGYSLNPHDVILDYDGLQRQRVFYAPQYATEKEQQSRLPDFRTLLDWSPDIHTDAHGKGQISFYTGDLPGKYLVEVQGISKNGDAGSNSFIFNVTQ